MNKLKQLVDWFDDKKKVLIALSGGVDSALVAYAAFTKLQKNAIAVTADYKTLSSEELDSSRTICSEIGIDQIFLDYNELENDSFVKNDSNRCYYCRLELGDHLKSLATKYHADCIVDGTNLDDLGDFRPGIDAIREKGIQSPLVETNFTKNDVRRITKSLGLSVHDKPSNSCLASRIPWGQRVTVEKLTRIELGEKFVKQMTHVNQIRIRDISGTAKIEVEKKQIPLLYKNIEKIDSQLKLLGYQNVIIDSEGYSPGKLNVIAD